MIEAAGPGLEKGSTQVIAGRDRSVYLLLIPLLALLALSEYLAVNRIFQVDELESVFTARILATHQSANYSANASLMFLGPMSWIAANIDHAALLLRTERLLFFPLFWINLWLVVRCAGLRVRTRQGLIALLLVATLVPLWDYGFEIRHETPLLTLILLAWSFARPLREGEPRRLFVVGALAVVAQFIAFKAFAYMGPILIYGLFAGWREERRPFYRVLASLVSGAAAAALLCLAILWSAGTWSLFSSDTRSLGHVAMSASHRMSALPTLSLLLVRAPFLVIAAGFALWRAAREFSVAGLTSARSLMPEVWLVLMALVALVVNPTPFPYNLVLIMPQAAILVLRLRPPVWTAYGFQRGVLGILLVLHVFWWVAFTRRHLAMTNARQTDLMSLAEQLTDPVHHAVLDGAGLVPTRHPPGRFWLIHTLTIDAFRNGTFSISRELAEGHTPVVILSYRTLGLPAADHQFMESHYVALAGDFLVAGSILPAQSSKQWECVVPGRYALVEPERGGVLMDGGPTRPGPLVIARGFHTFDNRSAEPSYLIWLGPFARTPPSLGPGSADRVFVNWY